MNGNKSRGEDRENRSAPTRPVAATFGLGSTAKIRDVHVNRLALVYVRQSTPQQVLENRESRERQYALAEFAQRLGWIDAHRPAPDGSHARRGSWLSIPS